jgi:ABC-type nitrate/sulfonate/bicarbonate transport system permease component
MPRGRIAMSLRHALLPLAAALGCFLAWEAAQRAGLLPVTVPAPSAIALTIADSAGAILFHLGPTVTAAIIGYGLAALATITLAGLATVLPRAAPGVLGTGIALHSVPLIALTPLFVLWLGPGLATRSIIAACACFFPMLIGAIQGFRAVDRSASELFHVIAATPLQRFRLLAFPSALPFLFSGFKIAAPSALLGTIVAEWAGASRGLGLLMLHALFAFQIEQVWASILVCSALAVLAYGIVALVERTVIHWDAQAAIAELEDG